MKKLSLKELKVNSFVTGTKEVNAKTVKGGSTFTWTLLPPAGCPIKHME